MRFYDICMIHSADWPTLSGVYTVVDARVPASFGRYSCPLDPRIVYTSDIILVVRLDIVASAATYSTVPSVQVT